MKKTIFYLVLAIFIALIIQPNIRTKITQGNQRVPENTKNGTIATNETIEFKTDVNDVTICLDAANNTNEANQEDINLSLTEKIGQSLEDAGFHVVYTRTTAESLTNQERIQIATNEKADYLVSITTNSDTDTLQRGYSIMTQENNSLINLSNNIAEQIERINYTTYQGIDSDHYANFPILTNLDIPAILIELGYTSNDNDLNNLSNQSTQDKIADAITKGFVNSQK